MTAFLPAYALAQIPRYTSYPPATRFDGAVGPDAYAGWLAAIPATDRLSLYLHLPFCRSLCWYCGCHTTVPNGEDRVRRYLAVLDREIAAVAGRIGATAGVVSVHLGGGTPTLLAPDALTALLGSLRARFDVRPDAEIAVEIDPRGLDDARIDALAAGGVTRASLGVQDVDREVQALIHRIQPLAVVEGAIRRLRDAGIAAINADLMYGLPGQTVAHVERSAAAVAALGVDRVAVFGYAHVPWFKAHQKAIDESRLPGARERFAQAEAAERTLCDAGYRAVGLDHFARPDDPLARAAGSGRLRRNFQGYVVDPAETLIGLGASAIGALRDGYAQNEPHLLRYAEAVEATGLATVRGVAISDDDRLRRAAIEAVMCDLTVDLAALCVRHGREPGAQDGVWRRLDPLLDDGLAARDGDRLRVTALGRRYVRNVAACFDAGFDAHLAGAGARHSRAV